MSNGGVGGAGGAGGGAGGSGAGTAAQAGAAPVLEPGLRWLGRVEKTATGARFAWPGTGFTARFNGTSAKVSMKTNQVDYFQLVVDGQVKLLTTQVGAHDYDVAQNLPAAEHTLTLWRRTENNAGVAEVTKVDFVGTLLSPPPPSSKRLEIVGDSISVGFGVECQTQAEAFSFATENNYQTYEAITARDLGAELMTMAWSGMGMWRDVGGSNASQMPERYLRAIGSEDASKWDFKSYAPGAVVVLLGTNDFAKGDPGQPFVDAYKQFVADMRGRYPLARIFLAQSPMLSGDRGTALAGYLEQVKSARAAAGDLNIGIVDFKPPAADAWGCGHPNGATHAIMAGVLKQALKQDLGW
jgi:Carbohydrate esterase 2 N-terminal/GDSL-like Lipase/Acylhydrolase family